MLSEKFPASPLGHRMWSLWPKRKRVTDETHVDEEAKTEPLITSEYVLLPPEPGWLPSEDLWLELSPWLGGQGLLLILRNTFEGPTCRKINDGHPVHLMCVLW